MTDKEITNLLKTDKNITDPPKKSMAIFQGSLRNNFKLESIDGKEKFKAFIRVNEKISESFSIGLDYISDEGKSICLLRCNGKHGIHKNHNTGEEFFDYHIHKATQKAIDNDENPEQYAYITKDYATWQDALLYFLNYINVLNYREHFPFLQQPNLFGTTNNDEVILI